MPLVFRILLAAGGIVQGSARRYRNAIAVSGKREGRDNLAHGLVRASGFRLSIALH